MQPGEGRPLGRLGLVEGEGQGELFVFEIETGEAQLPDAVQQRREILRCGGQRLLQRFDELHRNADGISAGHEVQQVLAGVEDVGQVPQLLHRDARCGNRDGLLVDGVRGRRLGGLLFLFGIGRLLAGLCVLSGLCIRLRFSLGGRFRILGRGLLSGGLLSGGLRVVGDVATCHQQVVNRGEVVAGDVAVAVDGVAADLVGAGGHPQVAVLGVQSLGDGLGQDLAVSGVRLNRHGACLLHVRGLKFAAACGPALWVAPYSLFPGYKSTGYVPTGMITL